MERVDGIGGLFFRARDPEALARWYEAHLGVSPVPKSYGESPWRQEAGPTVFAPFPADTDYFGRPEQQWMVNFRVRDLDAMAPRNSGPRASVSTSTPRPIPMAASPTSTTRRETGSSCGSRQGRLDGPGGAVPVLIEFSSTHLAGDIRHCGERCRRTVLSRFIGCTFPGGF